jgi:hypothetical protein
LKQPKIENGSSSYYHSVFMDEDIDREDLEKEIKAINWAQWKHYSKFSSRRGSLVVERIFDVEENLFVLLNFLYTNTFSKKNPEHVLFVSFAEKLQSYGDTFEDMLSTVKELFILVGPDWGIEVEPVELVEQEG